MKKRIVSIRWKLIATILPVVLISLVIVAIIASNISKSIILARTDTEMEATLGEYTNSIGGKLDVLKAQAAALGKAYGTVYKNMTPKQIKDFCVNAAKSNDMILGSGVWFEPYAYDKSKEYYGPYWYKELNTEGKDTGNIIEEWGYSNKEYDYFSQEYYTNAKNLKPVRQ